MSDEGSAEYRMSYLLRVGPPKPLAALDKDEGLTDHLMLVSINGTPGGPGALSMVPVMLGPEGRRPITAADLTAVATMLLGAAEGLSPLADAAMLAVRIQKGIAATRAAEISASFGAENRRRAGLR